MTTTAQGDVQADLTWGTAVGRRAPNIITFLRVLLVPVFVVLMVDPTPGQNLWAAAIFIFASLTDWLDGYLARRYCAQSKVGMLMDPLADKILVMAALVMLCATSPFPRIPAWMVVVLLAREFIVSGLRSMAAVTGIVVPASRWAKHKTAWTMLAISFLLIEEPYQIFGLTINFHTSGYVFLWLALFFSVITGAAYTYNLRRVLAE